MYTDCIFCKIVNSSNNFLYQDELVVAFQDLHPQAPHHVLIIPRSHIENLDQVLPEHALLLGNILLAGQKIARDLGVASSGYRIVNNCNRDAGQTVFHIHFHLLAGRLLAWPPG